MAKDESETRITANNIQGVILAGKIQNVTQNFFGSSPATGFPNRPIEESSPKEGQKEEEVGEEKELSILHLSDIHFGTDNDAALWYGQLAEDLKGDLNCNILDAVILSGDIATNSEPVEYDAAKNFIEKLCNEFRVETRHLIIVPGNHDLDRSISKKGYKLIDREEVKERLKEGFFIKVSDDVIRIRDEEGYKDRFQHFSAFYQEVKGESYPGDYGPQGIIHHLEEHNLLIAGFNSAWEMDHHFKERASICPDSVSHILDRIREDGKYGNCLKFAVWHHPLNSGKECRIKDHGFMERLAAAGFCVCFHGHIHKADAGLYRYDQSPGGRKIHIIGAGTFGAPPKNWVSGYPLQYNLIRISGKKLTVETRCRREINGAWKPDAIWGQGPGKDPLPRYFIELPVNVGKKPLPNLGIDSTSQGKVESNLESEIREYCKKAEALYEKIPLAGFKTALRVSIRVEDIYVPLRAMMDMRLTGKACFADAEDAENRLLECNGGMEIFVPDAFIEAEKRKRKGIVILGDPGSGKTTHLKRILLWCLGGGLTKLGLPPYMIPIFLPLRDLKNVDKDLDEFIQDQLDKPNLGTPKGFGKRLLSRGNLLFLLDGLDEVADTEERIKVSRWIESAQRIFTSCRFLVTCRFAGYTEEARLNEEFFEMHMRPLKEKEAELFIHKWYQVIETDHVSDPEQAKIIARTNAEDLINRLKQPEFRARRVFELTRNPLLLTNICLVHLSRGNLPHTRAALYDECTDVLLERWRESVGLKARFTSQTGRRALQPAAWWLHQKEGRTRAKAEALSPVIEPALKSAGWSQGSATDFLKAVRDESGLLTGWDQDHYGFMHLGFQEYLAAREIQNRAFLEKNIFQELASHFGDSWWQEVILLMLALDNPAAFIPFMQEVVKLPSFTKHPDLVEMCLDDTCEKSSQPFIELLEEAPGKDQGLWERQFTSLRIVERLNDPAVDRLSGQLITHPYEKIRTWCAGRKTERGRDVIRAGRGGYELVRIPGGVFKMGSPESEEGRFNDERLHKVRVSDFYMGRYPVTNEEYARFIEETPDVKPPAYWDDRNFNQPRQPIVGVSWDEANQYARWARLSLPTEAQWEYACRAGVNGKYYTGDSEADLDRAGWYENNSGGKTHPVGEKEPNACGLFDMHGNVWEWCLDSCDWDDKNKRVITSTYIDGVVDPVNTKGSVRVLRGGSWFNSAEVCRAASRYRYGPSGRDIVIGFRLVLIPGQQEKSRKTE